MNWFKKGCLFSLLALLLIATAGLVLSFFGREAEEDYPRDEAPRLQEIWSCGSGEVKAARIQLAGPIMRNEEDELFVHHADMVESLLTQIRAADRDPDMRAIILEVNSPGGAVTPSDEIHNALSRFRAGHPDRRVVAFIRDVGASGAYYAAMAADRVIAEPTAAVGSIGVILQTVNLQGLSEKLGIADVTIKSGANKDLLNPLRPVNTNQTALLQRLIDDTQRRFVSLVAQSRNLDPAAHPDLFDGRIFSATEALDRRLIDEIGYWEDALAGTAKLLGTGSLHVIRYEPHRTLLEQLLDARTPSLLPSLKQRAPNLLYLWKP